MVTNLAMLEFEKLVIHEVPHHSKSNFTDQLIFSEIESDLNDEVCNLLRSKIVETIENKAYNIVYIQNTKSPVPSIVEGLFIDDTNLIEQSKELAIHLNTIQDSRNPGGYLTIFIGKVKNHKVIGILKIEKEEGGRIQQSEKNGKRTFHILSLKDIILTKNTRFYKISVFFEDGPKNLGYNGKVCDNQLSKREEIADFYLKKFLGCEFVHDSKTRTKEFFIASEKFINENIDKPIDQVRYQHQLISYLASQIKEISPESFAKGHLDINYRDKYLEYLTQNGFQNESIKKDLTKIEKDVQFKILSFVDGVEIKGTRQSFDDHVKYEELADGQTRAEVISKLKKY
jgi:hypothetical protein